MGIKKAKYFYWSLLFSYLSVLMHCSLIAWLIVNKPPHLQTMEVNWYKGGAFPWTLPQRQYLDITFTGDTATDKIKMDFGQLYTRHLIKTKDTVHGLCFHFGDRCSYATFVAALDICNTGDVRTYAPSDEGLYIYN